MSEMMPPPYDSMERDLILRLGMPLKRKRDLFSAKGKTQFVVLCIKHEFMAD